MTKEELQNTIREKKKQLEAFEKERIQLAERERGLFSLSDKYKTLYFKAMGAINKMAPTIEESFALLGESWNMSRDAHNTKIDSFDQKFQLAINRSNVLHEKGSKGLTIPLSN